MLVPDLKNQTPKIRKVLRLRNRRDSAKNLVFFAGRSCENWEQEYARNFRNQTLNKRIITGGAEPGSCLSNTH